MLNTNAAQLEDFSGGITDFPIDAAPNRYQEADNLLVTINKKIKTVGGSVILDLAKAQLPTGNQRISDLINFQDLIFPYTNNKLFVEDVAWEPVTTVAGKDIFFNGDSNTQISHTEWNDHLLITNDVFDKTVKVYYDQSNNLKAVTAGLPNLTSPNAVGNAGGGNSYILGFHYVYTYNVGDVEYVDFGPVSFVQLTDIDAPDVSPIVITSIPTLSNAANESYDTANIKIRYYRTQANGDALQLVTELPNGTTNYNDNNADSSIVSNELLYTEGGILSNDPPPLAKYIHVANGACFYAHIKEGSNIYKYRLRQSVLGDPDSVPSGNFLDLEDEITGLSSFSDRVIVFGRNSTYRVDGVFDELGGGGLTYQKVSDTLGCISNKSIVQLPNGVVFADEDGFCFTDGFQVIRITDQLVKRYKDIVNTPTQRKRIFGNYDKENRRVYWSVQESETPIEDCNKMYILDTRWGISEESVFTTMSGGNNFSPCSFVFRNKELIRADKRGYIFKHSEAFLSTPLINTNLDPALWGTTAIIYNWVSIATSFGETKLRKFTPKMVISLENVSNISLQITSITDLKKSNTVSPLRFRGNFIWGDVLFKWDQDNFVWGGTGFIQQQRMFDGNDLRCTYKQIGLTNAETIIANSDALDTVTTNTTLKTITFDNPASFTFPEDLITYTVSFENDDYTFEFDVVSRSDDTLVLSDPSNLLPSGSGLKWVMRGFAKNEIMSLLTLTVMYAYLGSTQDYFTGNSIGNNN